MTDNRFQRGEDIQFFVNPTNIEGYTAQTEVKMVLYPDGIDLNRESSQSKIVVLSPVTDDDNLVFTATHIQTATMAVGDYTVELVYTISGNRSICKSERAFTLEDSATNHLNDNNE